LVARPVDVAVVEAVPVAHEGERLTAVHLAGAGVEVGARELVVHGLGDVQGDAADLVDHPGEAGERGGDDVAHVDAHELLDGPGLQVGTAERVGVVDLARPPPGDGHPRVPGNVEDGGRAGRRVHTDDVDRVRPVAVDAG